MVQSKLARTHILLYSTYQLYPQSHSLSPVVSADSEATLNYCAGCFFIWTIRIDKS